MLELAMTKKGWSDNIRSRSKSRERVALLGNHSNNQRNNVTTPSSSGNGSGRFGLRGRESRRRNRTDEEKVSLLGKSPGKIKKGSRRRKGAMRAPFTMSRMMKYIMVLLLSALVSFKLLRKEASNVGVINWDMHDKILRPKKGNEGKCVGESKDKLDAQCACANPWEAVANDDASRWKSNHDHMVHQANNAPQNLDIVFFGDGMVEQLSGTRDLGKEMVDGMESYFEKTFQRKTGGKYNAIALGSSGDTGPNLLWHWENGIKQANLKPKVWFIMVGGNDLYVNKCTDKFVMANVLNVAKQIFEDQPDSKIIVHGIMPRKDNFEIKSNRLGKLWKRAQGVNLDIRKFIKVHSERIFYMNLAPTLLQGFIKGARKEIDPSLIDGVYPTSKGMQKWGNLVAKKIVPILKGFDREAHMKQTKSPAKKDGDR